MDIPHISVLLAVAAFFGVVLRRFKQPLLIGYILAGAVLAALGILEDQQVIESLGNIGVTLLLFLVGLEMNIRELPSVGKSALLIGLTQILITFLLSFLTGIFFQIDIIDAAYLGLAVSFSSTIVIVKLLSEKNTLNSLYGKITVGILLVQDFAAILIMILLAGIDGGIMNAAAIIWFIVKAILLFTSVWVLSRKVFPYFFDKYIASSPDLIFIVSIAWALGLASFVAGPLGFSLEMGGLLAGLALSNLPEHLEIGSRTKPLKDFFLTIFFLSLGAMLINIELTLILIPMLVYTVLVIFVKPLVVMAIMAFMNFRRRTSFLTSVSLGQISEFSLKIVSVGVVLEHIGRETLALTVMVTAVSMILSTYLILGAEKLFNKINQRLLIFERKKPKDLVYLKNDPINDHVVLVGCLRTGLRLLPFLKRKNIPYIIVDFNPEIYNRLSTEGHPLIFGDITDSEILEASRINRARLVVSTIDSFNDNLVLLEYINRLEKKPMTIFTAGTRSNALRFYKNGADYVIVPEIVAGDHIRNLLKIYGIKSQRLKIAGKYHFNRLIFS